MKRNFFLSSVMLIAASFFVPSLVKAQMSRQSPHDTINSVVSGARIKVIYGSPAVKGREIWGGLVPYDKAWRAGADEATLFTTDKDVMIGGKKLAAGTYSVFVTPAKDKWTYTFNSQTGQWGVKQGGVANFDESKNVLTVTATPKSAAMSEHLKYQAGAKGFGLRWGKLEALVPIK